MSYTEDAIDRIVARLNEAGENWETVAAQMPEVRAIDQASGRARAVVELNAPRAHNETAGITDPYAILYRVDDTEPPTWHPLGWSTASRSRLGRNVGPNGVELTHAHTESAASTREKLAGLAGMFEAAAANPTLDNTFATDVHTYLRDEDDPSTNLGA